jgi:kynurenine 3-monooxygenase
VADLCIIGAGPVGSLLALTLARRGLSIEVYERRPDMREVGFAGGRSINLAVSTRGLHALHEVGLDAEVLQTAVPMQGRMMHALDGARNFLRYGRDDSEYIHSMSRGGLNALLMTKAEETGRVRIHFEKRLVGYEFGERTAVFEDGARVHMPVVIGTDGSASALRAAMPGAQIAQEFLSSGYKELTMPALPGGAFAMEKNALHIWPRGKFMLIALPNLDGSFTCTLFLPFEGSPSFAALTDEKAAEAFFEQYFPDALIPGLAPQFMSAPLGRMVTVKAWPWSRGEALLLGDAAHAIVPFFGQGMNAGFEDVTLLSTMLGGSWADVFTRFAAARKPDTDAIADLAVENFVEMRDRVADPAFLFQRKVEDELQRRMPGRYLSRYQLVTFTRLPYRVALEAGRIQAGLLRESIHGEQVDYPLAQRLAEERLVPLLRQNGVVQ